MNLNEGTFTVVEMSSNDIATTTWCSLSTMTELDLKTFPDLGSNNGIWIVEKTSANDQTLVLVGIIFKILNYKKSAN